jgi:phenylacetate-CoA ligase
MGSVNKIIKKSPFFIKKLYYNIVPFERRYGKVFHETFENLCKLRDLPIQNLQDYQYIKFMNLIEHAYQNVPYYRKIMIDRQLTPKSFKSVEDVSLLPFLTKDLITKNFDDLIAQNMKHIKPVEFRTSGSTGKKLIFLGTDDVYKKEAAFVLRAFKDHGATMYDKPSVWLRRFVPSGSEKLWYYDHELKRLYMSAYHLNLQSVKNYVSEINSKKYHTLVGYPSSIYVLACLCDEARLNLKHIKAIHTASEKMLPEWERKINDVFGIAPKSHYGMQEKVCFHHQTFDNDSYYENLEYGVTEFIEEDNQNIIVGTGFINYYMPFIRYKTNDTAVLSEKTNSLFRIENINGRCDDILISEDGCRLPGVNFYTMMYKIDGVKMFQIRQTNRETIDFYLVPNELFSDKTIDQIRLGLRQRLGNLKINILIKENIERSRITGKIRCIFNECD